MKEFLELLAGAPAFPCRPVGPETRGALTASGCSAEDWNRVFLSEGTDARLISGTRFMGEVRVHLPDGSISDARLMDTVIHGPVRISSVGLLRGYAVLCGSVLERCGELSMTGPPGVLSSAMDLGEETGLRRVPILPTMDHEEAFRMASGQGRERAMELLGSLSSLRPGGFIGPGAAVSNAPLVRNSIIAGEAALDCPGPVLESILLPGAMVCNQAQVHRSALQWGARVDTMALVTDSIVGENSVVERHGLLARSFLGADSVLGEGEMTASLAGPLTAMHHQSLLIAALWPGGRGNVGYGANAGSNHTSRLPDQELVMGEGCFIGLGVSVKFPGNYFESPYSVIATGLTVLPQKVSFPFSLLSRPAYRPQGVPEGHNQLSPGWALYGNLYSLARNAWKFSKRATATHSRVGTGLFTPAVMGPTRDALARLTGNPCDGMPGMGKNFMTEEDRLRGIQAYRTFLEAGELYGLLLSGGLDGNGKKRLLEIAGQVKEGVISSRLKDYTRGSAVISDYMTVRPQLEEEPFMIEFLQGLENMRRSLL